MTNRLARSVPFWVLVLASLASIGFGLWIVLSKIAAMSSTLADGSATYEQVYVNPVWIGFGGVFVGAGIVGLLLVLTLAALRSALPTPVTEAAVVEETVIVEAAPVTDEAPVFEDADVETSATDAAPPAAAAEAAAQAEAEPESEAPEKR
ncbi:dinucleotide-utilizing enzyme [Microbacterium schleiferi]|uniref:Dinucleotide-utilizing enzyme n=1 Tax=Microbacterium schleiferi TaxID=69362 RepID=A0A7S8MYU0_9MICO|nr:dinucleotide-utilizing enzyme [Microbacterium schleiferi]QPE05742.1 dinucleotide-utilizing enzyme [Microbacterium schleiferi]